MNFWFPIGQYVLLILHGCLDDLCLLGSPILTYVASQHGAKAGPGENSKKESHVTPFKSITEKFAAWRRYREAVRELAQLSDRELEDIGVRRGDIPFIAAGAARKAA
jgi:uncharacterized protein YjiS (DUF1127 family)